MKNIIIGLVIGILLNGLIVFASEKIITNPLQDVISILKWQPVSTTIKTTKVTTLDGTYRLFVLLGPEGSGGITAVRIK